MGEIADMMINGLMCEGCGVWMDDLDEPGYPRRCAGCQRDDEIGDIDRGSRQTAAAKKVKCPTCGKRVKEIGLKDHQRDAHKSDDLDVKGDKP